MRASDVPMPVRGHDGSLVGGGFAAIGTTTDPTDPRLTHTRDGDTTPRPQAEVYLVLSSEERAEGFCRPLRTAYRHRTCGSITTMGMALSETYARDPSFYSATYCCKCEMHRPVAEFTWEPNGRGDSGGQEVGS
jgi:hypothetical protein